MLRYVKGAAPRCLTSLSATPLATWDHVHGDQRDEIRSCLVRDQASLCAYCQRRIHAKGTMKIEHWAARSLGGSHFQWTNLLGTCDGIAPGVPARRYGEPVEPRFHCDTERGNQPLFLHPVVGQNQDPRKFLRYQGDGSVSATQEQASRDLRTLNLNAGYLRRGRRAALDALKSRLDRLGWETGALATELRAVELKPGTTALEHAEFLRYHLERWLRKQPGNA